MQDPIYAMLRCGVERVGKELEALPYERLLDAEDLSRSEVIEGVEVAFRGRNDRRQQDRGHPDLHRRRCARQGLARQMAGGTVVRVLEAKRWERSLLTVSARRISGDSASVSEAFTQQAWACRCEWGLAGAAALARADVTIVVDVLSFTTCVDVAVSRGVAILPYAWNDASAEEFARAQGAELAGKRRQARYSLAPESYLDAPGGLRCVLPSPNGAQVTLAAARTANVLLAGSLRNARAVAAAAARLGTTFNVIPAGERWPDGSLRPALEDWLGAGAILQWLPGRRSPEAESAVALFERYRDELVATLNQCASGRELAERGHGRDTSIAGALDASSSVARFDGVAFVAA
jgi:2-phosphosulfolactate phosphatase